MNTFLNPYFIGTVLNLSGIYMTGALGNSFSIKAGDYNLGGEGLIYAGGFITAIFLAKVSAVSMPAFVAIPLAFLISFLLCGLISLLSALLKEFKNVSFLLTSFIFSAAIIPLIDGLISGKFRGDTGNLLSTAFIADSYRFKQILPPSSFNVSLIFCIIFCIIGFFVIFKSSWGNKLQIYGISPEFSAYSGIDSKLISFPAAIISGGFHGIAGFLSICGTYYTCHSGFYSGIGWNCLSAAIIAGGNPLLVIPSSIFLAIIISVANRIALINNFNFDISSLIQAIILILISIPLIKSGKIAKLLAFSKNLKISDKENSKNE